MRTIRRGSSGPDVQTWQRLAGATADGVFGPGTEAKTRAWQAAAGLVPDGVVGAKSWRAAGVAGAAGGLGDPRAPACVAAVRDADARWPGRDLRSDGIMGDATHQKGASDHNTGDAVDITHDPASGCDAGAIALASIEDPRVTYVIWNARIFNRARAAEGWRPYDGPNPHRHHVHVSVRVDARGDDRPWAWAPARASGGGLAGLLGGLLVLAAVVLVVTR